MWDVIHGDWRGGRLVMSRLLAGSCDEGPCPTLWLEPSGDVKVQGYVTTFDRPVPAGEDVVHIDAAAWGRLLADLPVSMLVRALVAPWRFRRTRISEAATSAATPGAR
jgi:hypothetical protein